MCKHYLDQNDIGRVNYAYERLEKFGFQHNDAELRYYQSKPAEVLAHFEMCDTSPQRLATILCVRMRSTMFGLALLAEQDPKVDEAIRAIIKAMGILDPDGNP